MRIKEYCTGNNLKMPLTSRLVNANGQFDRFKYTWICARRNEWQ